MAGQVFTLPRCYPDFPTRPRLLEIGSPGPGRARNREPLPVAWKPINQVRIRQFQKQIESIKKLSYDLNRQPHPSHTLKSDDFADKVRIGNESERQRQVSVGAFPRVDLHKEVLGLIKGLKEVCAGLNENFKLVSGDLGQWRDGQDVCPLCKGTNRVRGEAGDGTIRGPEIRLESRKYVQKCRSCGDSVLCDKEDRGYICVPCACGSKNRPEPGTVSLYLPFDIEETGEKIRERAISLERLASKAVKRTISSQNPSFQAKIGGIPVSLRPGCQFIRLILSRNWSDFVQFPSISPKLLATSPSLSPTHTPEYDQNPEVSFSEETPIPKPRTASLLIDTKPLHISAERTLTDHIHFAHKHADLLESSDLLQSYVCQYTDLLGKVWKLLLPISPEAVSTMEMCVKGVILLFETYLLTKKHEFKPDNERIRSSSSHISTPFSIREAIPS